jgi:ferredoxin--NADP+ reductase/benzoate/toluate 1,2-dioxygenase reductase subunit
MSAEKFNSRIIEVKNLSSSLYLLYLERNGLNFIPGQHITLGISGEEKSRVYSVASGISDKYLNVLIREIKNGDLSIRFRELKLGTTIEITTPVGYFSLPENFTNKKIICIATGSGIAPFLSFSKSYPEFNFMIIHGIRNNEDSLKTELSTSATYITCTSKSRDGSFIGRVTSYIKSIKTDKDAYYYLCGNGEMIHEIYTHLKKENISKDQIYYEEYFNN